MKNEAIAFSGSSTKIQFHFGVAEELARLGYEPEYFDGCSGGAIVQLFMSANKFDKEVIDTFLDVQAGDVFDIEPMNKNNKITFKAKVRALLGRSSLGSQKNLLEMIKTNFTAQDYEQIKETKKKVFVTVFNMNTRFAESVNICRPSMNYETAMKFVYASASIPLAVEPVKIGRSWYYDGGVVEHNGGKNLAKRKHIKKLVTVWSRPDILTKVKNTRVSNFWEQWQPGDLKKNGARVLDGIVFNTSLEDEETIDALCEINKTTQEKVFPKYQLMNELYKFDKDLQRSMYEHGKERARTMFVSMKQKE
jgi:predicted patatin/cPLA2 family phospholipase